MPTVARYDLTIYQGLPLTQPFAPEDPTGARVDYTGYTATFTLWQAPQTLDSLHDLTPVLSLTDAAGAVELGLFDGGAFGDYGILLTLTHQQTSDLEPFGIGFYCLDVIDPYGHPQLRLSGTVAFEEGQTHA